MCDICAEPGINIEFHPLSPGMEPVILKWALLIERKVGVISARGCV